MLCELLARLRVSDERFRRPRDDRADRFSGSQRPVVEPQPQSWRLGPVERVERLDRLAVVIRGLASPGFPKGHHLR
jgi:hypothetical protein